LAGRLSNQDPTKFSEFLTGIGASGGSNQAPPSSQQSSKADLFLLNDRKNIWKKKCGEDEDVVYFQNIVAYTKEIHGANTSVDDLLGNEDFTDETGAEVDCKQYLCGRRRRDQLLAEVGLARDQNGQLVLGLIDTGSVSDGPVHDEKSEDSLAKILAVLSARESSTSAMSLAQVEMLQRQQAAMLEMVALARSHQFPVMQPVYPPQGGYPQGISGYQYQAMGRPIETPQGGPDIGGGGYPQRFPTPLPEAWGDTLQDHTMPPVAVPSGSSGGSGNTTAPSPEVPVPVGTPVKVEPPEPTGIPTSGGNTTSNASDGTGVGIPGRERRASVKSPPPPPSKP
jgi:hypothetical protein